MRTAPKSKSGPVSTATVTGTGSGSSISGRSVSTGTPLTAMRIDPP